MGNNNVIQHKNKKHVNKGRAAEYIMTKNKKIQCNAGSNPDFS